MSKPPGIRLGIGAHGPTMRVSPSDRTTDKIWEAVEAAVMADWTGERFRRESKEAWRYYANVLRDANVDEP